MYSRLIQISKCTFVFPQVPCLFTISKHFYSAIKEACINIKYLYLCDSDLQNLALE